MKNFSDMKRLKKIEIYGICSNTLMFQSDINNLIIFEINQQYRNMKDSKIVEIYLDVSVLNIINVIIEYTNEKTSAMEVVDLLFKSNFIAELSL